MKSLICCRCGESKEIIIINHLKKIILLVFISLNAFAIDGYQFSDGSIQTTAAGFAGTVSITATSYTVSSTQNGIYFTYNHSVSGTINLPALSAVNSGFQVTVSRQVAQAVTIDPNAAETFDNGIATIELQGQNIKSMTITKLGSFWTITNKTDDCIVGQSCWVTNHIYVGSYNGKQYFTTPGGCTDSATPTCAGGTDTVTKAWASGSPTPSASNTTTGASNYKDGRAQTTSLASTYNDTQAAKFCENMSYAGYSDWYLPAKQELSFLYQQSHNISGFWYGPGSTAYWPSTDGATTNAWNFSFSNGSFINSLKTGTPYVRCIRRF